MIAALAALLGLQLIGEALARGLGLPVPGPVLGMALLAAALMLRPAWIGLLRPAAGGLLGHLSLLFVPAGVGVVGHLARLGEAWAAVALALLASTALALAAGAGAFVLVARLTGTGEDG
jgi:putative effector of murein hydrolase LrgA (UPF0299 family)